MHIHTFKVCIRYRSVNIKEDYYVNTCSSCRFRILLYSLQFMGNGISMYDQAQPELLFFLLYFFFNERKFVVSHPHIATVLSKLHEAKSDPSALMSMEVTVLE